MRTIILNISKFATLSVAMFALLASTSTPAVARGFSGKIFVGDSSKDHVVELLKPERDGGVEEAHALDSGPVEFSVITDMHFDGGERFFVLDGGSSDQIVAVDIETGTMSIFAVADDELTLGTPNDLVTGALPGSLLLADDGSGKDRLLSLTDGVWKIVLDNDNASGVSIEDPQALARGPGGIVYLIDVVAGSILACLDRDEDGCFQGIGEVWLAYGSSGEKGLGDVLEAQFSRGVLYLAEKRSGNVLAFTDRNGDGDFSDERESWTFLDGEVPGASSDLRAFALTASGCLIFVDAAADTISVAFDANDSDSIEEGEISILFSDPALISSPSALIVVEDPLDPDPEPLPSEVFVRGDANFSDSVDITDAVLALEYLLLGMVRVNCVDALDSDDNGEIEISDPIYLLNHLFVGGGAPPAPFPGRAVDPTEDELGCVVGFPRN